MRDVEDVIPYNVRVVSLIHYSSFIIHYSSFIIHFPSPYPLPHKIFNYFLIPSLFFCGFMLE